MEGESTDTLTGEWTVTNTTDDTFHEDDTWNTALVDQSFSQMPLSSYLVVEDQFGNESAASNDPQANDCSSDPCSLSISTSLVQSRDITAVLTDYTADDLDRNLEVSGQPAGI